MKKLNYKVIQSGFLGFILLMTISLIASPKASAQVDTLWSIQAPTNNWFGIGNTERGLTLNHSTGNLILASRQGGVTPVIIDSETGDSLGLLKTSKPPSEAPTPVWSFSAPKSTWFGTGNTERGLGFNHATGNLIVASRQGGVTPILIDAATGDSVGMLKTIRSAKENPEPLWTITAPTSNWFGTGNTERGLGFNPATGNLIVASRQGGVTPVLVDAATGDSVGILSNTGISGGIFPFNQIKASTDGQIFTANLAINGESRIYRWANETADPELVFADSLGQRLGDSFGVVGSADSVHVFLSGTGATKVVPFFWDGTSLTKKADYTVAAGEARGGFSGHAIADSIVITGTGTAPRYMNALDGTLGTQLASADVASGDLNSVMVNDQFTYKGKHYVVAGPAFTNGKFYMLDVTDPANATLVHELGPIGNNTNGNNTGGVVFDDATGKLYIMDTNNAIAAYSMSDFVDMPVISGGIFAFNQIKASTDGQIFTANLAINGESRIYRWADETAEPELVFAGELGGRLGDSFGVYGEDDKVRVLLSGTGADKVEVFDWDGSAMVHAATFPVDAGAARGGFSSHVFEDSVLITGTGTAPRLMNLTDGGLSPNIVSVGIDQTTLNSSMLNDFAFIDGEFIIVTGPAFTDGKFYISIPGEDDHTLENVGEIGPLGNNTNGNNTGGVIFNEMTGHLYLMDTNNQLAAYNIYDFMPEPGPAANLIFSEYIEGSSNNKAIEIANMGQFEADLAQYRIAQSVNGSGWKYYHQFPIDAYIEPGIPYVILNSSVHDTLFDKDFADEVLDYPSVVHHNGDDARAIIRVVRGDTTLIDVFGDPDNDPGSGWDVAGVSTATKDHTLVRKGNVTQGVTEPLLSFGSDEASSEWEVRPKNDFSDLGYHGQSGPTTVMFTVNTSTMPDTLQDYHFMQIRGGFVGPDVDDAASSGMITWDSASRHMYNEGGDYWWADFPMSPGDTLNYKFWAGVDPETPLINGSEQGWESGGNNQFILPADFAEGDTVVALQFYETREAPYTSHEDSISLYFKVNIGAKAQLGDFDPDNDIIGVRGGAEFIGNWGSTLALNQTSSQGDNLFYGGQATVHKDSLVNFTNPVEYKFVIEHSSGEVTWESTPNRVFNMPDSDSTMHWVFFNNEPPTDAEILSTTLNFEVNVGILEGLGYFNSSIDHVFVRGSFNSWSEQNQMVFNSFSGTYEETGIPFTTTVGAEVGYKYYIKWDASRDDESSTNYLPGITHDGSGWEEPGVTGGGDRFFQMAEGADQPKRSEFFNGVDPKALLTSNNVEGGAISVTFSIDMSPAAQHTSQPFDASNDSVYLFVDTPFFALTNDITVPGDGGSNFLNITDEERESLRFTDENGDMVYELTLELKLPTLNHIGFRIAYGEPTSADGSLFTHGSGFAAGRRHYQYVQPIVSNEGAVTWPSSFTMPTLTWKAEDLDWETPPDYNTPTTSSEEEVEIVDQYALNQNYPNPFNPTTNISFSLKDAVPVKLTVYNLLGQEVATLISGKVMNAGTHTVAFNASSMSSGVYIYRLEAGSFVSNKRMTLIK